MPAMEAGTLETIILAAIVGTGMSVGFYLLLRQMWMLLLAVSR